MDIFTHGITGLLISRTLPSGSKTLLVQLLDGFKTTADNFGGLLPEFFRAVGFQEVEETARYMTVVGTLSLYRARKPR